jgi:hypothetical protein
MFIRLLSFLLLCICTFFNAIGQNLSFSKPVQFLNGAKTDKAFDITKFKDGYFVTWKTAGATGEANVAYLGKEYDTTFSQAEQIVEKGTTAFAPVLRSLDNRIYMLWITIDGSVAYIVNNTDTSFDTKTVYTVKFKQSAKVTGGITAAPFTNKLMIAAHADNKDQMVFAIIAVDKNGLLEEADLQIVPNKKSAEYPFVVALNEKEARFCWRGYKDQQIYYADYRLDTQIWEDQTPLNESSTRVSPAMFHVFDGANLFYIWKGSKNNNRIYYSVGQKDNPPTPETQLPDYYTTPYPIAICSAGSNKFIMGFVGDDQKVYLCYFTKYNPATWMADVLFPKKEYYSLKDIVIPGAHDAGMSVLSGVGGQQSGTINHCNVLTQKLNIEGQLNAGIRMFDLRIGSFNNEYYTKHCSSDCMADAIGGGYGERLSSILQSLKSFLQKNTKEFVVLTLSHFCEREAPAKDVADSIIEMLGIDLIYKNDGKNIGQIQLKDLQGKAIVTFENFARTDNLIDSSTINGNTRVFLNMRREYAATNNIVKLTTKQNAFFNNAKNGIQNNDWVRLDWQLTQSPDEAAIICNDFQDEKTSPLLSGAMLLTKAIKKYQSIIDLSLKGNKYLPSSVNGWINDGTINNVNKPNVLYVDAAGAWITDYCIELNNLPIYQR